MQADLSIIKLRSKHEYPDQEETIYHCDICVYEDIYGEMKGHIITEHTMEEVVETMMESSRQRRKLEAIVRSLRHD